MLSVIICHSPERFLWFPRHVWESLVVFAIVIIFYKAENFNGRLRSLKSLIAKRNYYMENAGGKWHY
jgi:hypothetical protein